MFLNNSKCRTSLEKCGSSICWKFASQHKTYQIGKDIQKVWQNPIDSYSYKHGKIIPAKGTIEQSAIFDSVHLLRFKRSGRSKY